MKCYKQTQKAPHCGADLLTRCFLCPLPKFQSSIAITGALL